ncbi:MAG: ASKHA domain-containing protein [Candidatus Helarchaeota archaeon]|nr:ASKHA domain-containing protein [Candidatus Helarchaeota archaeon]
MMKEYQLVFQPEGKRVKVPRGKTILEGALSGGIDLISVCGGMAKCGKCKVLIEETNAVNPLTEKEKEILSDAEIKSGIRLACSTKIHDNLMVKIPEYSRTGKQKLQIEGIDTPIKLAPTTTKIYLELEPPTLEDPKSDADRIQNMLREKLNISNLSINYELLKNLSQKVRESDWKITVVIWKDEIIGIESGNTVNKLYGYAVDIGTTKLAGYLINLTNGKVVAAGSLMNPQIPYGEDVIARLNYPQPDKLQAAVVKGINEILDDLKGKTGINSMEIYEMTAVGNTVMHHLFLNLNSPYLGFTPFPPVIRSSVVVSSRDVRININSAGKIYCLPVIAGFVGADTVGVILATEIYKRDEICLALDIGTNTEVVLGNKNKILACSCASGPAFEGAHIKFGMRAAGGAIEKVEIVPNSLDLTYQTIDNESPIGICGSGMIDLMAEMFKTGIIDFGGTFNKEIKNSRIRQGDDGIELVVVSADETKFQKDITFSQKDIRQIILAKAAMQTGIKILLKHYNINKADIEKLFLAGAFGSHINKESARMVGIYPEIEFDKVVSVGNAAGTGARMSLISNLGKSLADEISNKVVYVELGADKDFQRLFLNSNFIPDADFSDYPKTSEILKKYGTFPKVLPPKF